MKSIKYVYVSGPITGDGSVPREVSCRKAILVATELIDAGFAPFIPHLNLLWNMLTPRDERTWMEYDLDWVKRCDAVLRVEGPSKGADEECALAEMLGIPVFHRIDEMMQKQPK